MIKWRGFCWVGRYYDVVMLGGGPAIRGITQRVFHKHSVLATFAKIGPQRASGVRIVALRPCCCFEPRRAWVELG